MIRDLDDTLESLLKIKALTGSELAGAKISFDLPDAEWRQKIERLTVNLYLYDIRENQQLCASEPIMHRSADNKRAVHLRPPVRIDCSYCITAWSAASAESVLEEHRLLGQVLLVLLQNGKIPKEVLKGSLINQIPPYPTVIASADGIKNQPEFWGALNQQLKPSLNYVVTLAMMLDDIPAEDKMAPLPEQEKIAIDVNNLT